jgi:hypothetical protein
MVDLGATDRENGEEKRVNDRKLGYRSVRMTIQKRIGVVLIPIALGGLVHAQVAPIRSYTEVQWAELTGKFRDFLSIPNVAADPDGLKQNADFLLSALRDRA